MMVKSNYTLKVYEDNRCLLLSPEGYWEGPGLGWFNSPKEAKEWAKNKGYTVARKYARVLERPMTNVSYGPSPIKDVRGN